MFRKNPLWPRLWLFPWDLCFVCFFFSCVKIWWSSRTQTQWHLFGRSWWALGKKKFFVCVCVSFSPLRNQMLTLTPQNFKKKKKKKPALFGNWLCPQLRSCFPFFNSNLFVYNTTPVTNQKKKRTGFVFSYGINLYTVQKKKRTRKEMEGESPNSVRIKRSFVEALFVFDLTVESGGITVRAMNGKTKQLYLVHLDEKKCSELSHGLFFPEAMFKALQKGYFFVCLKFFFFVLFEMKRCRNKKEFSLLLLWSRYFLCLFFSWGI